MGVAEGHCGLASWNVSVRNAGDGQLPAGWVMQDTGSGVWYTKQLLQDSLHVTVDGKQLTGTMQVSSDNGKTWINLDKAQESQRYTTPTWLGRAATSSAYCGTDTAVMWEYTWQCGQLIARLRSWWWCRRLLEST